MWGGTALRKPAPISRPISIHPPRVGWDHSQAGRRDKIKIFQSTHPVWGGTGLLALHCLGTKHFNPPTPCGVGLGFVCPRHKLETFQSTHPVWGGTPCSIQAVHRKHISIHPPRVGWDCFASNFCGVRRNFNPPTPCGVGLFLPTTPQGAVDISIHPPRVGWDHVSPPFPSTPPHFNPPTPCGVGLPRRWPQFRQRPISIHPPRVGWDPGSDA